MKTILTTHLLISIVLLPITGVAQLISISGYVTDSLSQHFMQNVTVFDPSSNIGTITDNNGFFKLFLTKGEMEIEISKAGYKPYSNKIVLKADTTLSVQLVPEIEFKSHRKKQGEIDAVAKNQRKIAGIHHFR